MNCPRCTDTGMEHKERLGITVDICPACRGVWLDRGELEKILARAAEEAEEERRWAERKPSAPAAPQFPQYPPYADQRYQAWPKKKKTWYETLGDIFD